MPYVLIYKDKPDSLELRTRLRPPHIDYLAEHQAKLLAGGAMIGDDGSGGDGGVIILDTEDRKVAEAFAANDPFTKGGLFESVTIRRWRKAFFNGAKLV